MAFSSDASASVNVTKFISKELGGVFHISVPLSDIEKDRGVVNIKVYVNDSKCSGREFLNILDEVEKNCHYSEYISQVCNKHLDNFKLPQVMKTSKNKGEMKFSLLLFQL